MNVSTAILVNVKQATLGAHHGGTVLLVGEGWTQDMATKRLQDQAKTYMGFDPALDDESDYDRIVITDEDWANRRTLTTGSLVITDTGQCC